VNLPIKSKVVVVLVSYYLLSNSRTDMGSSSWTWGRPSLLLEWQSTGTGCPEGLWILLLRRYSNTSWTRSCAACSRWLYFVRGVGL